LEIFAPGAAGISFGQEVGCGWARLCGAARSDCQPPGREVSSPFKIGTVPECLGNDSYSQEEARACTVSSGISGSLVGML